MYKFKKNDMVIVIKGKDKGKKGKILQNQPKERFAIVENINIKKKHLKQNKETKGGIISIPSKISWSNLMLVSSKSNNPEKVKYQIIKEKKERVSKKTGELI